MGRWRVILDSGIVIKDVCEFDMPKLGERLVFMLLKQVFWLVKWQW